MTQEYRKSFSSSQLALLYSLSNMLFLNINIIKSIGVTNEELDFLIKNNYVKNVVDDNKYQLTSRGLSVIDKKHSIIYSTGVPYTDVFSTLTKTAANNMLNVMLDTDFFDKIESDVSKQKLVTNLINSSYFTRIKGILIHEIFENITFHNTSRIPIGVITSTYSIFKSKLKYYIENSKLTEEDYVFNDYVYCKNGVMYGLDDLSFDQLIAIVEIIKE